VEAFYIVGSALAVLALLVAALGITGRDFPRSAGLERAIGVVFAVMVLAAIGAAVVGASSESEAEGDEDHGDESALVLPG
jgi:hypothetical protein